MQSREHIPAKKWPHLGSCSAASSAAPSASSSFSPLGLAPELPFRLRELLSGHCRRSAAARRLNERPFIGPPRQSGRPSVAHKRLLISWPLAERWPAGRLAGWLASLPPTSKPGWPESRCGVRAPDRWAPLGEGPRRRRRMLRAASIKLANRPHALGPLISVASSRVARPHTDKQARTLRETRTRPEGNTRTQRERERDSEHEDCCWAATLEGDSSPVVATSCPPLSTGSVQQPGRAAAALCSAAAQRSRGSSKQLGGLPLPLRLRLRLRWAASE